MFIQAPTRSNYIPRIFNYPLFIISYKLLGLRVMILGLLKTYLEIVRLRSVMKHRQLIDVTRMEVHGQTC